MQTSPLITTIIPTYRRPALLRRAIESALEQQGASLLVRVLDNASGDATCDVVARLAASDPRIDYVCHAENIGAPANFEFGLRSVTTPFFSIVSDDDYLLPDFYRSALADLDAHPEAMFWAGLTLNVDEQGTIWDARLERWSREGVFLPPEGVLASTHGRAPTWTGILFRREILDCIGTPDWEVLGPADLDFTLKAAASHPFVLRKHPSAVFTLSSASLSATQPLSSFWPGWKKMFRNVEVFEQLDAADREGLLGALHADARRMLFRRGANALAAGRHEFARDAAQALETAYSDRMSACTLRLLAFVCLNVPGAQRLLTGSYRAVERRMVRSRSDLRSRYGHLLRAP
ncbi:MAG: glycosyltransferase family 2 protein [Dokdonella sp.]